MGSLLFIYHLIIAEQASG